MLLKKKGKEKEEFSVIEALWMQRNLALSSELFQVCGKDHSMKESINFCAEKQSDAKARKKDSSLGVLFYLFLNCQAT